MPGLAAAEAAVHSAELDLSYCRVRAPFTGLVVNMNISNGAFARTGVEVFTLVDTRTWYVVANFRETQLRHIPAGAPVDLYLQSQPSKHFRGTVVGLGWAVLPENGTSVNGLPRVERSLDWIRLAARFPVRIKVDNPDDSFRLGASAVATVQRHLARGRSMTASSSPRLSAPRARADPGKRQRNLPAHPGLSRCDHSDLDPPDSACGLIVMIIMYLITQEDTAATLIGSILGVIGVTIGLGLALLAWRISLDIEWLRLCFFIAFLFGGSVPQARSNDRRDGLRHRPAGSSRDDPSGYSTRLIRKCWSSLVLWIWWCVTLGLSVNARRATLVVAGRPSNAAATGAGHAT